LRFIPFRLFQISREDETLLKRLPHKLEASKQSKEGESMDGSEQTKNKAHIFTLRIWAANKGGTAPQWRSRLQNIQSGEVTFCHNWENLIANIEEMLREDKINLIEQQENLK
jgi:hypothetical protein